MSSVQILEKEGSQVSLDNEVVVKLVEQIINEIDGAELFNAEYNSIKDLVAKNPFAKAIKVDYLNDSIRVTINLSISIGKNIQNIALEVQEKVSQDIETFTGLKVESVPVTVVNVI